MTAALAVTIDVDGEAGLPEGGRGWGRRLSSRSERLYGVVRGLPRLLDVLAVAEAHATLFFPGITAERHPDAVEMALERGHELALHGYSHRRLDGMSDAQQAADLEAGLRAFETVVGCAPRGYRAPGWELTETTLELLAPNGLVYDSSLMADDRPYLTAGIVELPVHGSLDDAPYFETAGAADELLEVWREELGVAIREQRLLTVTTHPEILGRPYRVGVLQRILEAAAARGCPVVTLGEASVDARQQLARRDSERASDADERREPRVLPGALDP